MSASPLMPRFAPERRGSWQSSPIPDLAALRRNLAREIESGQVIVVDGVGVQVFGVRVRVRVFGGQARGQVRARHRSVRPSRAGSGAGPSCSSWPSATVTWSDITSHSRRPGPGSRLRTGIDSFNGDSRRPGRLSWGPVQLASRAGHRAPARGCGERRTGSTSRCNGRSRRLQMGPGATAARRSVRPRKVSPQAKLTAPGAQRRAIQLRRASRQSRAAPSSSAVDSARDAARPPCGSAAAAGSPSASARSSARTAQPVATIRQNAAARSSAIARSPSNAPVRTASARATTSSALGGLTTPARTSSTGRDARRARRPARTTRGARGCPPGSRRAATTPRAACRRAGRTTGRRPRRSRARR